MSDRGGVTLHVAEVITDYCAQRYQNKTNSQYIANINRMFLLKRQLLERIGVKTKWFFREIFKKV